MPLDRCSRIINFFTNYKYTRHWAERHIKVSTKLYCAVAVCRAVCRRTDIKTRIKCRHFERDQTKVNIILAKCEKIREENKGFIDPGFYAYRGRTAKPSVTSKTTSQKSAASSIDKPAISSTVSIPPSSTIAVPSSAPKSPENPEYNTESSSPPDASDKDVQFNVLIPSTLPQFVDKSSPKKVSLSEYKARTKTTSHCSITPPVVKPTTSDGSSQTSCMDVQEVYLPPIPTTIPDVEEYLRFLCNTMDRVGRLRESAKARLDALRRNGPSLQKERELRRQLESENRRLKREIVEMKWRDTVFPENL